MNLEPQMTQSVRSVSLFMSHATADARVLQWLEAQVRACGIEPYLAEHDPQPGRPLADKLTERIQTSDAVLVVLTEAGYNSIFVQQEIGAARQAGKRLVVLVDQPTLARDRAMLEGVEVIAFDTDDLAASSAVLTATLASLSARRGFAPPPTEIRSQPIVQLEMSLQLQLTGDELLFGLFLLSACAGLAYLAIRESGAGLTA